MGFSRLHITKKPGAFEYIFGTETRPWNFVRLAKAGYWNSLAIHDNAVLPGTNLLSGNPHDGIIFHQMGDGFHIGEIVDPNYFNVCEGRILAQGPENITPDSAKSINTHFYRHSIPLLLRKFRIRAGHYPLSIPRVSRRTALRCEG